VGSFELREWVGTAHGGDCRPSRAPVP
jgi:hypothetical protein